MASMNTEIYREDGRFAGKVPHCPPLPAPRLIPAACCRRRPARSLPLLPPRVPLPLADMYRMFAGWPANYGMWAFGNEVVCCYTVGSYENKSLTKNKVRPARLRCLLHPSHP